MKITIEGVKPDEVERGLAMLCIGQPYQIAKARAEGKGCAFVLRIRSQCEHFRGLGHHGRRTIAVCWHGHRDFFDRVFQQYPEAKVRSTIAKYDGVLDYKRQVAKGPTLRNSSWGPVPAGFEATHNCAC